MHGEPTTVTVAGLPAGAYDVYVYADGDNGSATRTGGYRISGAGITTTTINLTDAGNTNFNATFTQANNSTGNFVKFSINASGFTLTATPGTSSSGATRAPVNGIQIVSTAATDARLHDRGDARCADGHAGERHELHGHHRRAERVCGHGEPGGERPAGERHGVVHASFVVTGRARHVECDDGSEHAGRQFDAHHHRIEWRTHAQRHRSSWS